MLVLMLMLDSYATGFLRRQKLQVYIVDSTKTGVVGTQCVVTLFKAKVPSFPVYNPWSISLPDFRIKYTPMIMLRVRLFVHVHHLILVYYVFPQLVKRVLIHSLINFCVHAAPTLWNALDLDIRLLPFDAFKKKSQDTSLSEVLCTLILIVFILFVLYLCFYNVYLLWLLCISL